ncbi:hypothetical protein CDAR_224531 [Caerostris darwini]|uniref:Secreted protein n=1 Tax=Caerostris darwini TaxID=1538125 RepID=A0AAV4WXD7_9ARAC|nr:hypothetical protein CDAR_224531 [Caerostris darwini]
MDMALLVCCIAPALLSAVFVYFAGETEYLVDFWTLGYSFYPSTRSVIRHDCGTIRFRLYRCCAFDIADSFLFQDT